MTMAVSRHAMCTGLAVVGGRYLAGKIPERTVLFAGGGCLFCLPSMRLLWAEARTIISFMNIASERNLHKSSEHVLY